MLLQMAIMLTLASSMIEWILYYNFPRLVALMHGRTWLDIVFSMCLSVVMGAFFGANGVVIMIAGMASTVLTPMGMPFIRWLQRNQSEFPRWKATIEAWWSQFTEVGRDLALTVFAVMRIVTTPARWAYRFISHPRTKEVLAYVGNRG